ncbi:MAG TPA: radical SAM protein, partial [Desulfobacteria bacterium]|nr:radical SAM protein [Desulfobacteria bacterium]
IAHGKPDTVTVSPEKLIAAASNSKEKSVGIAYTYSEPLMWYEFVYDTAKEARAAGLKNVLVTNGFVNPEPLKEIIPLIDAMNIDVKGFSDSYYNEACVGELHPVLETVELASKHCHVEITTLLVTGLNDSPDEISQLVDWLAGVDPEIPLHFSRYFPNYQMELPPTPISTMEMARDIAQRKLNYVYLGNLRNTDAVNTYCPKCKELLINRSGYQASLVGLADNKCIHCGRKINIVNE